MACKRRIAASYTFGETLFDARFVLDRHCSLVVNELSVQHAVV